MRWGRHASVSRPRQIGYAGAGTIEIHRRRLWRAANGTVLFHGDEHPLQVEHPVTEAITGIVLVQCKLRVADGRRVAVAAG